MQISLGAIRLKPAVQTYLFLFENGDIISEMAYLGFWETAHLPLPLAIILP